MLVKRRLLYSEISTVKKKLYLSDNFSSHCLYHLDGRLRKNIECSANRNLISTLNETSFKNFQMIKIFVEFEIKMKHKKVRYLLMLTLIYIIFQASPTERQFLQGYLVETKKKSLYLIYNLMVEKFC